MVPAASAAAVVLMATKGGSDIEAAPLRANEAGINISDDVGGHGVTGAVLAFFSFCLVILFFPFSLISAIKVPAAVLMSWMLMRVHLCTDCEGV